MAVGVGSPSGRRSYGHHKRGAHPVAAVAKARSGDPRRGHGSALTGRCSSASSRSRRAVVEGYARTGGRRM